MKRMKLMGYVLGSVALVGCGMEEEGLVADTAQSTSGRRVYVGFQPGHGGDVKQLIAAGGGVMHHEFDAYGAVVASLPEAAITGLTNNPHVAYIEDDVPRYPSGTPGQAEVPPYGIAMVQANLVPDTDANNRKICIIDSGYAVHEDLPQGITNITGQGSGWRTDKCGHGTHVAGTIAALDNEIGVVGVLPHGNVKLHIVQVFSGESCAWTYSSTLVAATDECAAAGANVISMSLGGGGRSTAEEAAFAKHWKNGILSVAAASNDGKDIDTADPLSYPASYPSVMSVAAVDANKVHAYFSNENSAVDIAAPGVGVESTLPTIIDDTRIVIGTGLEAITISGSHVEGSGRTDGAGVSGALVDGGTCGAKGPWKGKIVLCKRGITFATMVKNVKAGGGRGAILYNVPNPNVPEHDCGAVSATLGTTPSTIPAISISCADGETAYAHKGEGAKLVSELIDGQSTYEAWSGTSMATPHVAGVAALAWSYNPTRSNNWLRAALERTAEDRGAVGPDITYGNGLVQALGAKNFMLSLPEVATAPVIEPESVTSVKEGRRGGFTITWTTTEDSESRVRFVFSTGPDQVFDSVSMTSSHSMSFTGQARTNYEYFVSSRNVDGTTSESGPHFHQN